MTLKTATSFCPTGAVAAAPPVERIVMRPDGWHWISVDGRQEFGPFETSDLARADMNAATDQTPEPVMTVQEAEAGLGLIDRIDPETGEPDAWPGQPHLAEE